MLYDLNIAWSPSTSAPDLQRTLKFASSLGYDVVVLNHTISPPIPQKITNPLPKFPEASTATATRDAASSSLPPRTFALPTVLHRATVVLVEGDHSAGHRLAQLAQAYDMLAVRPQTEKDFSAACLTMDHASVISLDMTQRFPFHFKPKSCMAAVNRGLRFEISYAQMLGADPRGRANFIGNVMNLLRATRNRGVTISSGAKDVMGLRGPADVVNLLAVWGLPTDKGMEGLGVVPRSIIMNEGVKRRGFRGVIDIVEVAERPEGDKMEGVEIEGKQKEDANQNAGKKRKGPEGQGQGEGEKPMSKRQMKKMKKLAMMEGNPENKQTS